MKSELEVMKARQVWHLESLPDGCIPVGCRWVYTLKRDDKGNIAKYKARLVAQGFKQIKGDTYDETFSPVVNFGIIRFFFSILVVYLKWVHIQCDVASAYLYAPLKEKIFMTQPPGFSVPGKENMYCRLDRALYGLHQSGRLWYYEIHNVLIKLGFTKLESCNCVYTFKNEVVLLLYVDDMIIFGKNDKYAQNALNLIEEKFDLKVLGRTHKLLGVEFEGDKNHLLIHQHQYIAEVLQRFDKYKIPVSSLPIAKGCVYSKKDCPVNYSDISEMKSIPYRSLIGCLSFIASRTRPDIAYATNIFSQFQESPGMQHWEGLLRLLGYVRYTQYYKLKLKCDLPLINAFSDADFASNRDDRTSMGGQIIFLDKSPIDWRAFKEKCISLSTMESEFIAMTETSKNLIWYDRVLLESQKLNIIPTYHKSTLHVDNQAAIDFVKSPIENHRTKHIDVKLHFIRDLIYKETFNLVFTRSKNNMADVFTKPLSKLALRAFIESCFDNTN